MFLVDALPVSGRLVLDGAEGHHAAKVRRIRMGERVALSDGAGGLATCTVVGVAAGGSLELRVDTFAQVPAPDPRLVVVQALAKGDRGELAVELMTELGVDEVMPWAAERSVAQWRGERAARGLHRWRAAAREATKQSRRAWLPEISTACDTAGVAGRLRTATRALVLHEAAGAPLAGVELPPAGEIVLVVGPEGGLTPDELDTFAAAGGLACRLGPNVLRTSTGGAAALAALSVRTGRWA